MKSKSEFWLYEKYHSGRDNERTGLFAVIDENYEVERSLYPGSFVHVTPSLFFPYTVYVDSYKQAEGFFDDEEVYEFINKKKRYKEELIVKFYLSDYYKKFEEERESFDLLISQYAGFVSQACKEYLKIGGILVANNSHGDASMAYLDSDYEFIGVYDRRSDEKYLIKEESLNEYFIPKKDIKVTKELLKETNRGVGYTKSPVGYVFRRIK